MIMFRIAHKELANGSAFVGYGEFEAAAMCAQMQNIHKVELVEIRNDYACVFGHCEVCDPQEMTSAITDMLKTLVHPQIGCIVVHGKSTIHILYVVSRGAKIKLLAESELVTSQSTAH